MIPILYESKETDFTTNGIGHLVDATYCEAYEERNGRFELEFGYPPGGIHEKLITEDKIVKAKVNDRDGEQLFRIVSSRKTVNDTTIWKAEHVSYDALYLPIRIPSIANKNAQEAMNQLLELTPLEHSFKAYSDIETLNSTTIDSVVSVRGALGGVEGSILDTYGGEYRFDNYDIYLLKERGVDAGVEIRYGKNLIDANMEKNISNTITAIYPYATYYTEDGNSVLVTLDEQILYAPNAGKYATIRCVPCDLTYAFEGEAITQDMLREAATEYVNSGIDIPEVSIKVKFANIADYADDVELIETVGMCDTVGVYIERLGIETKAKVVAYTYDTLKELYIEVQIGSFRNNLVKDINFSEKEISESLKDANRKILLKVERGTVSNQLSIEEGGIEIKGNRIAIISDYYKLSADGKIVARQAEIEGTIRSSNAIITGGSLDVGGNFSVTKEGKMTAKEVEIDGGTLNVGEKYNVTSDGVLTSKDGIFLGTITAYDGIVLRQKLNGVSLYRTYNLVTVNGTADETTQRIYDHTGEVFRTQSIGSNYVYSDRTWSVAGLSVSGTKSREVTTKNYNERLLYCYETATPYFGDIGEGCTDEAGTCYVFLDDIFSETIDVGCDYQVFLQPYGAGDIYVSERNSVYFVVQGAPNLSFGWEVKAIQKDYDTYRLDVPVKDEVAKSDYAAETYDYLASALYDAEKESEEIICLI